VRIEPATNTNKTFKASTQSLGYSMFDANFVPQNQLSNTVNVGFEKI
jgi:hypothetical protein